MYTYWPFATCTSLQCVHIDFPTGYLNSVRFSKSKYFSFELYVNINVKQYTKVHLYVYTIHTQTRVVYIIYTVYTYAHI